MGCILLEGKEAGICFHLECSEAGGCRNHIHWHNIHWAAYIRGLSVRKSVPPLYNKRVRLSSRWEILDRLPAHLTSYPFKICDHSGTKCDKSRTCGILGQCLFEHPLIMDNDTAITRLKPLSSMRKINKILTELMPSLARIGNKKFFRDPADE